MRITDWLLRRLSLWSLRFWNWRAGIAFKRAARYDRWRNGRAR